MDYVRVVKLLILVVILAYALFSYYSLADTLTHQEIERGGKGYVSDEVWYVSSARNLLYKVFHVEPRCYNKSSATVIYEENISVTHFLIYNLARESGVRVVDSGYGKLRKAVYVEADNRSAIEAFVDKLKNYTSVKTVVYGWRLADAENIHEYLNLEHPPLVKYLIALTMVALGDYPTYWRIPFIVAGVLLVLFSYLLASAILRDDLVALVVAAAVAVEPLTRVMASIALLDIYVALFSVLSAYLLVKRRYLPALLVIAIGGTAKFNTLFMLIPFLIIVIRDYVRRHRGSFYALLYGGALYILLSVAIVFCMQVIVSIPIINHVGFTNWLNYSLFGAIKWHTSIKCTVNCPPSSAPWEWFFGINGFPVYFFTSGEGLYAIGSSFFWSIALAYSIAFLPSYMLRRSCRWSLLFLYGVFSGYLLLWIIGGRTQYSFYSIQLLPFVYTTLAVFSKDIVLSRKIAIETLCLWKNLLEYLWNSLLKLLLIS